MSQDLKGIRKGPYEYSGILFFSGRKYIRYKFPDVRVYSVFSRAKNRPIWLERRAPGGKG